MGDAGLPVRLGRTKIRENPNRGPRTTPPRRFVQRSIQKMRHPRGVGGRRGNHQFLPRQTQLRPPRRPQGRRGGGQFLAPSLHLPRAARRVSARRQLASLAAQGPRAPRGGRPGALRPRAAGVPRHPGCALKARRSTQFGSNHCRQIGI